MSLALELQDRGTEVLVLDRGKPGNEASPAAAGMLAPADPETNVLLRPLAFESARLYPGFVRKLEDASGMQVDFRRQGTISFLPVSDPPPLYRKLSTEELHRLEPAIQPSSSTPYFVQEASVDPRLLMQAALAAARNRGISVHGNVEVTKMRRGGECVEVVAGGTLRRARSAVNCRGAWAVQPVRPRKGQMLSLRPRELELLRHSVVTSEVYLVPRSSGRILVGATVEDVGYDRTVEPHVIKKLHHAAAQLVPKLKNLPIEESWAGLRPGSPDDLPLLGETETRGVFIATGHFRNGILLAPLTARIIADLIAAKTTLIDISAFSPARFAIANSISERS